MALPPSFTTDGFVTPEKARRKPGSQFRRLMIGTEGRADTGKTEFLLTCPGPGIVVVMDRGFDAVFDNPKPPTTRRTDFGFHVVSAPGSLMATKDAYEDHWIAFRDKVYKAIVNTDARTVCIDGDSDSWELQRLAEHGRLTGIYPQTQYTDVKAKRRGFYSRLWDSGKIIIATNKVKEEWEEVKGTDGNTLKDGKGETVRKSTGRYVAQGFPDQEYLWQIRLRHLFLPARISAKGRPIAKQWGIQILKCKANMDLVGSELWGDDCNFASLVALVYPHIDPKEWGL